VVDHAEVLTRLRAYVSRKPAHGARDLLAEMARLEAECTVDDDAYRRVLARFGDELDAAFLNVLSSADPTTGAAAPAPAVVAADSPSTGAVSSTEEDPCRTLKSRPGRPTALVS
jgi:hypothetical protein